MLGRHLRRKAVVVRPRFSAGLPWGPETRSIRAEIRGTQVISAYSISQGEGWNDGINNCLPAGYLQTSMAALTAQEFDEFQVQKTQHGSQLGVGLATARGAREDEVICRASALFFDDRLILSTFLGMPGNDTFTGKVVVIPGVAREDGGTTGPVFAVLVGVAQHLQHFQGIKARPNASLKCEPMLGFNNAGEGALRIVCQTRGGYGIRVGGEILIDYGAAYDMRAPCPGRAGGGGGEVGPAAVRPGRSRSR